MTIVALAPQTNIAMLLRDHLGKVATAIGQLIFVGGRVVEPEPPEPAEFNVGHDPEAAAIVLDSGLAITMTDWMSSTRCSSRPRRPMRWPNRCIRRPGWQVSCCAYGPVA